MKVNESSSPCIKYSKPKTQFSGEKKEKKTQNSIFVPVDFTLPSKVSFCSLQTGWLEELVVTSFQPWSTLRPISSNPSAPQGYRPTDCKVPADNS